MKRMVGKAALPALALTRTVKRGVVIALDIFFCALSVWFAYYLRLGFFVPFYSAMAWPLMVSVLLALPLFVRFGLYRAIFRYSGLPAMMAVSRVMLLYGLVFASLFTLYGVQGVPRTIGLIQPLLLLMLVGGSRAIARIWLGGIYLKRLRGVPVKRVLVYGAGSAGQQLAAAITSNPEACVVGFLDDDAQLHGHMLNGLPIYNPLDLAETLDEIEVTDVLLALPSIQRERRNAILRFLEPFKVSVRTLPPLDDIVNGAVSFSDVRELEIDDLLGREPVMPDKQLLNLNITDKTVLVTGAGGSIGSELCRQIVKTHPKRLLLVEMSEFALYQIHQELCCLLERDGAGGDEGGEGVPGERVEIVPLLASVCDAGRMHDIMNAWQPQTVYHAAAYKHVPLVEHNPVEGLRNNVWGTRICAEAALSNGVKDFVLISTDKAVRPTNIMGASKRLAEMVLQALSDTASVQGIDSRTCLSMVRFGNVLGSSGSVVPLFREQIENGGPVTLTHPEITRYFMTIPEAAQLVIQAGAMGIGGDVFVLDMGEAVKIADLARRMVELSGLTVKEPSNPDGDIEIAVTGLRPGEKLYEELLIGNNPEPTGHSRIMKAHEPFLAWQELVRQLDELSLAMRDNDMPAIRGKLQHVVPDYQPDGDVVDWVYLACGCKLAGHAS